MIGDALLRATLRALARALRDGDAEELTRTGALLDVLIAERPRRAVVILEVLLLVDDDALTLETRAGLEEVARELGPDPDAAVARTRLAALWRTLGRRSDTPPASLVTVIEQHLAASLDGRVRLGDLARRLGYSPSHLSTLIRRTTGRTFVALRRRLRFERACALLREGASVKAAALAAGFDDPAYFSRLFKRRVGVPPSRWRDDRLRSARASRMP